MTWRLRGRGGGPLNKLSKLRVVLCLLVLAGGAAPSATGRVGGGRGSRDLGLAFRTPRHRKLRAGLGGDTHDVKRWGLGLGPAPPMREGARLRSAGGLS